MSAAINSGRGSSRRLREKKNVTDCGGFLRPFTGSLFAGIAPASTERSTPALPLISTAFCTLALPASRVTVSSSSLTRAVRRSRSVSRLVTSASRSSIRRAFSAPTLPLR